MAVFQDYATNQHWHLPSDVAHDNPTTQAGQLHGSVASIYFEVHATALGQ